MVSDCKGQNSFRTSKQALIPLYKSLVRMHPEQVSMSEFKEEQVKTRANKIIEGGENLFYGLE